MASMAHTWQDEHRWWSRRQLRRRQSRHRKGWLLVGARVGGNTTGPVARGGSGGGFDEAGLRLVQPGTVIPPIMSKPRQFSFAPTPHMRWALYLASGQET